MLIGVWKLEKKNFSKVVGLVEYDSAAISIVLVPLEGRISMSEAHEFVVNPDDMIAAKQSVSIKNLISRT